MPYTVWSRDTLIGESELEPLPGTGKSLGGVFSPTLAAESALDAFGAMFDALNKLGEILPGKFARDVNSPHRGQVIFGAMHGTPEGREMIERQSEIRALELRLRDPQGVLVNTKTIAIADTRRLLGPGFDDLSEEDQAEGRAAGFTHYILSVTLAA